MGWERDCANSCVNKSQARAYKRLYCKGPSGTESYLDEMSFLHAFYIRKVVGFV